MHDTNRDMGSDRMLHVMQCLDPMASLVEVLQLTALGFTCLIICIILHRDLVFVCFTQRIQ